MLTANAYLWVTAIILPLIFRFGMASTKFRWPIRSPLLPIWPALSANKLHSMAVGELADDPENPSKH